MEKKSFLRKSWENYFLSITKKRISNNSAQDEELMIINDKNKLDEVLSRPGIDDKIKLLLVSIPLNNFDNLVDFFKSIDSKFSDETKIIVNYYSILWRPFFFLMSKIGITHYFKNECYFSKKIFDIFLESTNYKISHYIDEPPIPINIFGISKVFYLLTNFFPILKFLSVTKICYLQKKTISKDYVIKKASIIIPCKNEEDNIKKIIQDTSSLEFPFELVFIDDKSEDKIFLKL